VQSATADLAEGSKSQSPSGQFAIPQLLAEELSTTAPRPFILSWTHYVFLLSIKNPDERSFYEIEAAGQNWTVRELKRQFDSSLYERLALSRDKAGINKLASEGQTVTQPLDLLKIEHFLLELGKGFLFEARQKRFTFDGDHYFIDLVFYNRLLRCYVLIDLNHPLQAKEQGPGGNHAPQRRQYPRPRVSTVFTEQGGVAKETGRVGAGSGGGR